MYFNFPMAGQIFFDGQATNNLAFQGNRRIKNVKPRLPDLRTAEFYRAILSVEWTTALEQNCSV